MATFLEDIFVLSRGWNPILDDLRDTNYIHQLEITNSSVELVEQRVREEIGSHLKSIGDMHDAYIYIMDHHILHQSAKQRDEEDRLLEDDAMVTVIEEARIPFVFLKVLSEYRVEHSLRKPLTFMVLQVGTDLVPPLVSLYQDLANSHVRHFIGRVGKDMWAEYKIAPVCLEIPPYPGSKEWREEVELLAELDGLERGKAEFRMHERQLSDKELAMYLVRFLLEHPSGTVAGNSVFLYHGNTLFGPSQPRWSVLSNN